MLAATIVVPFHNAAATLSRCLGALLADRPDNVAVVCVDDGSTDESAAIAGRFQVRLVRHEHRRGASAARNTGARATDAPVLVFVDADVAVRAGAVRALLHTLDADPELRGANGLFALDLSAPGVVTAFVNTSIHYQHLQHGARVASAFTGLCAMRRAAWEDMGGWDESTSRYADDVATRWVFPPRSIALVPDALGEHLKSVELRGLLRHRYAVGSHFVRSVAANGAAVRARPSATLLGARYPLNTLAAAGTVAVLPFLRRRPWLAALPVLAFTAINADFAVFTLRRRGPVEAAVAVPISALEGFAYGLGMSAGAIHLLQGAIR
jgi:GT2 family glycosyltransferase